MEEDWESEEGPDEFKSDVWSPSGFATVPRWLHKTGVSDRAFRIYCILAQMQGSRGKDAHPTRATLMRMTKSSEMSVHRAIRELESCGALTIVGRVRPDGGRAASGYIIHYNNQYAEELPGVWTDTPPVTSATPPASPMMPTPHHPWCLPGITGDAPKNKNLEEKQPRKNNVAATPTPAATERGKPRTLSLKDRNELRTKWGSKVSNLDHIIDNALNHKASLKVIDLKRYVNNWIGRDYDRQQATRQQLSAIPDAFASVSDTDWEAEE